MQPPAIFKSRRQSPLLWVLINALAFGAVLGALFLCFSALGSGVPLADAAPLAPSGLAFLFFGGLRELQQRRENNRKAALKRTEEINAATAKDNRLMTAEEKAELDTFTALIADCDTQIAAAKLLQNEEKLMPAAARVEVVTAEEDQPWTGAGEFFRAVARAGLSNGAVFDPRLKRAAAPAGASEGDPSAGGFLVQADYSTKLLDRAVQAAQLLPRCDRNPISSPSNRMVLPIVDETSRATGSRWGGIRVYRLAEANAATIAIGKFGRLEIVAERMDGLCAVTDELLEDASALEAFISRAFSSEFSWMADDEILNGNGVGKCLGILNAPALVSVAKENGQGAKTIITQNIFNMWSRMWAPSRRNAVWFINQEIEPQLFSMVLAVGAGGIPVYMPANGLSDSPFGTLMGRPVIPVEQCQALGAQGDIFLLDLSQYTIVEKGGLRQDSSMHVYFSTHQTAFRFTTRFNGQPAWKSALTPARGTSTKTLGPYVTLDARA